MFPLDFPYRALHNAPPGSIVLDPFCGRGTTLFAARLLHLESVGIDSNPVAAAIARAKLVSIDSCEVVSFCEHIFTRAGTSIDLPEGEFWSWCYNLNTLIEICMIRDFLSKQSSFDAAIALRALMLGILHGPVMKGEPSYLSNQMPRTYSTKPDAAVTFWEARNMRPRRVNTMNVVGRRARYIFEKVPDPIDGEVIRGDIRKVHLGKSRRFTHVVTSPPYLGMRCYVPDQWLRNWFLGADEDVTYDESEQIGLGTRDSFIRNLAGVWARVAGVCARGARMAVRFGALPSLEEDPSSIIKDSLGESDAGWNVITVRSVLPPPKARRQACQFT